MDTNASASSGDPKRVDEYRKEEEQTILDELNAGDANNLAEKKDDKEITKTRKKRERVNPIIKAQEAQIRIPQKALDDRTGDPATKQPKQSESDVESDEEVSPEKEKTR